MIQNLLIDIGNSTTVISTYDQGVLNPYKCHPTHDLQSCLDSIEFAPENVVVSSVVPSMNALIDSRFDSTFFINSDTIPTLSFSISNPSQVGADRLVTALAAYHIYEKNCLIIDSGTAITFERVTFDGAYLGGMILPGMELASKSLNDYTAQIPLIWVEPRNSLLGGNTKDAVASGLYFGYKEMINGLIRKFRTETPDLVVLGAGNGFSIFQNQLDIDHYHNDLQMKGLAIVCDFLIKERKSLNDEVTG